MPRNPTRPRLRPLAALAATALLGAAPHAPPRRIVSLNLCADQLVIALADRAQIAGLTEWARDSRLSLYAARARTLPFTRRNAEEVLALRPDVAIGASARLGSVLAARGRPGLRLVDLPMADGLAGIDASITTVAAAIGHPERGRAAIATLRADLARIGPPPGRKRVAAFYQRDGYLTGTGTLIDDAMTRVGLVNLARRLRRPPLSALSVEELALARPDFLVMNADARSAVDRGSAMLRSPVLARAVPPAHHLALPTALTLCGTPDYPRAVALLAAQVRAADRRR